MVTWLGELFDKPQQVKALRDAPLSEALDEQELRRRYKQIYGGVAWPGKEPGFVVIIGCSHLARSEHYDIFLLTEYESHDLRTLVRQCGALNHRYAPDRWLGDKLNDGADKFLMELNHDPSEPRLSICPSMIREMEQPFPYILSTLKNLLNPEHRQLFLKDSEVLGRLSAVEPSEIMEMQWGDYPSIEALSFAVLEMRRQCRVESPVESDYNKKSSRRIPSGWAS
jgi:hypothetical protein